MLNIHESLKFGRSGNFISLNFCGIFMSFTALTALAGAAEIPA
jgi:hypothetical protein